MTDQNNRRKIVLITGATAGIGKATAEALAQKNWHIILHGRSEQRCQALAAELCQAYPQAKVDYLVADFSSLKSVRNMSQQVKQNYSHLDVLINNAGSFFMNRQVSQDGFELTLAVNHLAPFLLTTELLNTLKASQAARIVNVSSGAHAGVALNFDDLQLERRFAGFQAYGGSKLMNIYFTYELHRRLQADNLAGNQVCVNVLHPGFVATEFAKNNGGIFRFAMELMKKLHIGNPKSPAKGAETSVFLASSDSVAGVSGKYFDNCVEVRSSKVSYDQNAAARLWEWSEKAVR